MKNKILVLAILGILLINMIMFDFNKRKSFYSLEAVACESMYGIEYSVILLMEDCMFYNGSTWRYGCADSNGTCGGYEN